MVCSNLPAGSRIERVLLFSLEMKTLPVPFASRDLVGASAIVTTVLARPVMARTISRLP